MPLHWAVCMQAPLDVVDSLLKAFPEGAKAKGYDGNLPLHDAAEEQAPLEVVAALLKAFPEGAKEKDEDGWLPLHYAAVNQKNICFDKRGVVVVVSSAVACRDRGRGCYRPQVAAGKKNDPQKDGQVEEEVK